MRLPRTISFDNEFTRYFNEINFGFYSAAYIALHYSYSYWNIFVYNRVNNSQVVYVVLEYLLKTRVSVFFRVSCTILFLVGAF